MKNLLTIAFILTAFISNAQIEFENPTYGNFKFDNSERKSSWVMVFNIDSTITAEEIKSYFTKNLIFKFENDSKTEIIGELVKSKIEPSKYGYSSWNAPMIFENPILGNVLVEIKTGRYRVTIRNIRYINNGVSDIILKPLSNNLPSSKGNEEYLDGSVTFEDIGYVKTRSKKVFLILDKYFTEISLYKILKKTNDDF